MMMYSNYKSSANANVNVDGNLAISLSQYAGYEDYNNVDLSTDDNPDVDKRFSEINKELSHISDENIISFNLYKDKSMKERKERLLKFKLPMFVKSRCMKGVLGFRECANLINIADETGTVITLISNSKVGSTKSMSSLIMLGLSEGKSVTVRFDGGDVHKAYLMTKDVLDGITVERVR